jgi:hypothetical protein
MASLVKTNQITSEVSSIAPPLIPKSFVALKAPKRAASRESLSDAVNIIRRVAVDKIAATEYSLAASWRYGCLLFDNCCYICGLPFSDSSRPQADHVVPPIEGGSGNAGNILAAHQKCNAHKGDVHPDEYFSDSPEILSKITKLQDAFSYSADKDLFATATLIANEMAEILTKRVIHARNVRELALEDSGADSLAVSSKVDKPIVAHLMSAVHYYLELEAFAPSAKVKMRSYTRRILQKWYDTHDDDLFTQDEETLRAFITSFCLELTNHPDSFRRGHRAFRILAEVFSSKSLLSIYEDSVPLTLAELQETHSFTGESWVKRESLGQITVEPQLSLREI